MIRVGWWVIALLVAAGTGCTGRVAADRPAPASTSTSPAAITATAHTATTITAPVPSRTPDSPPRATPAPSPTLAWPAEPVSDAATAAGLLDIRTLVPDAIVDLRYATSHNFVGVPLYPADARCLVHSSMAPGLRVAADRLRRAGYLLVFWDCYRPHPVQVRMFQIVPDPTWVARPGPYARSHEAGRSVDVTLAYASGSHSCAADQRVRSHCLLTMGTGFDDFSARAHAFAQDGVSRQAQADRARLRSAMGAGGLTVYSGEWWHFDGPGASVARPHLDVFLD